jgi:hypothetical protein
MPDNLIDSSVKDTSDESNVNQEVVDWKSHIPADLQDKGYWKPLENADLSTVLKTLGHAQEQIGKKSLIPDEHTPKEEAEEFFRKLGKPESPDNYELTEPDVKGYKWGDESFKSFKHAIHEANLSQKQAEAIVDWYKKDLTTKVDSAEEQGLDAAATTEAKLKRELGQDYEMNMALAKRASNLYYGNDTTEAWFDTLPEPVIRGLLKLGNQLAEDKVLGKHPPELNGVTSKEKALARIAEITADRSGAYWSRTETAEKKAAMDEMNALHQIAFPEGS